MEFLLLACVAPDHSSNAAVGDPIVVSPDDNRDDAEDTHSPTEINVSVTGTLVVQAEDDTGQPARLDGRITTWRRPSGISGSVNGPQI
jgi:hypothetical protein